MKKYILLMLVLCLLLSSCVSEKRETISRLEQRVESYVTLSKAESESSAADTREIDRVISDYARAVDAYAGMITSDYNAIAVLKACISAKLSDEACLEAQNKLASLRKTLDGETLAESEFSQNAVAAFTEYNISYPDYLVAFSNYGIMKTTSVNLIESYTAFMNNCLNLKESETRVNTYAELYTKYADVRQKQTTAYKCYLFYSINTIFFAVDGAYDCFVGSDSVFADSALIWRSDRDEAERLAYLYLDDMEEAINEMTKLSREGEKDVNGDKAQSASLIEHLKNASDRITDWMGEIDTLYKSFRKLLADTAEYSKEPGVTASRKLSSEAAVISAKALELANKSFSLTEDESKALGDYEIDDTSINQSATGCSEAAKTIYYCAEQIITMLNAFAAKDEFGEFSEKAIKYTDSFSVYAMRFINYAYTGLFDEVSQYCSAALASKVVYMTVPEWVSVRSEVVDIINGSSSAVAEARDAVSDFINDFREKRGLE